MTTQIIEAPAPVVTERTAGTDEGGHDRFAHYVTKAALEKAILDGIPCRALCGKMWLPTRDAQKYPVCPECEDIWESMPDG